MRKLLHSVSYAGLWGQAFLPVNDFVAKAAELGFDGVMLMAKRPHVSILDYTELQRRALRAYLENRGLPEPVIAGYCNFTADMEHSEVPMREMQVHYIMELAQLARDLGGRIVRVFTGYEHPAADVNRQWRLIVDCLQEASRRAADLDIIIGVQNHHDIAVGYESFADLLAAVAEPNCKALFDAWAPALHGADLITAAKRLAPVTVHTTVADYQLRPRYTYHPALVNYTSETPYAQAVPMGEGFIDYPGFFQAMKDGGFHGSVAYEMCSPLLHGGDIGTLDRYARRFLEYMQQVS